MTPIAASATASAPDSRGGLLAALLANFTWGVLPILFFFLDSVDPVEVVATRTICSLVIVGGIVVGMRRMGEVREALADRRTAGTLLLSALLLAVNWLIYIYAVQSGRVLEGSFGFFITPMINVGIGMLMLGERQSAGQIGAMLLALLAIGIQAVGLGSFPYISLGLALSFGLYGYLRKTVKANAVTGLFVETLLLTPLASGYLAYSVWTAGPGAFADPTLLWLLLATGPATATPLLLFAFAVQRLRLTTIGMLQYISPSLQFGLAITFFGEPLGPLRLISFGLAWASLVWFSMDGLRQRRRAAVFDKI